MKIEGTKEELIKFKKLIRSGVITINSRKELKSLLDWYDELKETDNERRNIITKIYGNYKEAQLKN